MSSVLDNKKIAIVYDWLDKWGGVERVLLGLSEIFPEADFYTSYWDKEKASWAKNLKIKTSFIQKLPLFIKQNRLLSFILYPFAFESFDFSGYDLVISVTSSFAKSIITKPGTKHLCYLLTPTRYIWLYPELYLKNILSRLLFHYINIMKRWDYMAAQRPDKIITISQTVSDRCRKYYQRDSETVYPPFDTDYWTNINSKLKTQSSKLQLKTQYYFLIVSRLEPYKEIEYVVQSFNLSSLKLRRAGRLNADLVIVGEGTEEKKLKSIAEKNIHFFKNLTDKELGWLYSNAQGLIMPQEEDFGYVSLEAQFFGCPVIAYKKGGATETIVNGKTGVFFNQQTAEALTAALERYKKIAYNLKYLTKRVGQDNINKFDKKIFIDNFKKLL